MITEGLACPICGEHTRRLWRQLGIDDSYIMQTDCINKECPGYYRTLEPNAFMEEFKGVKHGLR